MFEKLGMDYDGRFYSGFDDFKNIVWIVVWMF